MTESIQQLSLIQEAAFVMIIVISVAYFVSFFHDRDWIKSSCEIQISVSFIILLLLMILYLIWLLYNVFPMPVGGGLISVAIVILIIAILLILFLQQAVPFYKRAKRTQKITTGVGKLFTIITGKKPTVSGLLGLAQNLGQLNFKNLTKKQLLEIADLFKEFTEDEDMKYNPNAVWKWLKEKGLESVASKAIDDLLNEIQEKLGDETISQEDKNKLNELKEKLEELKNAKP